MPMHDWTKVPDGTFGALQHHWLCNLSEEMNRKLPGKYYSLIERLPDLVMPHRENFERVEYTDPTEMTDLRGLVTIRRSDHRRLVAVIKIMTPWNAANQETMNVVARKISRLLDQGVHALVFDPYAHFKPSIFEAIWKIINGSTEPPATRKPMLFISCRGMEKPEVYLEELNVGDLLPTMPLFLSSETCIEVPLEATYSIAFNALPLVWRDKLV